MKKLLSILAVVFLFSSTGFSQITYDRGFAFGVKAGLNISTVSTGLGERAQPKTGLQAGFYGRVKFSQSVCISSRVKLFIAGCW